MAFNLALPVISRETAAIKDTEDAKPGLLHSCLGAGRDALMPQTHEDAPFPSCDIFLPSYFLHHLPLSLPRASIPVRLVEDALSLDSTIIYSRIH